MLEDPLESVFRYHEQTKHHLDRYARSLGYLDWAAQPDPFRRFQGAPQLPLDHPPPTAEPSYDSLFAGVPVASAPLNRSWIAELFYHSLALSAWKQAPGANRWSLRTNPSSGALHPTEGYLIAGAVDGLSGRSAVYHYSPFEHALEQRIVLTTEEWSQLSASLPRGSVLIALTSIYWRESWKYGERAFRYCQHDAGHAIGSVAIAAALSGWQARLITTVSDDALAALLGTNRQHGPEAEHPDCLMAVSPRGSQIVAPKFEVHVPPPLIERLATADFEGTPNELSREHHAWPAIDEVARAVHYLAESDVGEAAAPTATEPEEAVGSPAVGHDASPAADQDDAAVAGQPVEGSTFSNLDDRGLPARQIIRQRRSAVEMDARTQISRQAMYHLLERLMPRGFPFDVLPWEPAVSLALFVHRVDGLPPGLYLLVRDPDHEPDLRSSLKSDFLWQRPEACPNELNLWCLAQADCQRAARIISCQQAIASDGIFSLGMLARFEPSVRQQGAWFYPRLFWEAGLIGQVLYLEAEAARLRGTGIGCYFDDAMHEVLGIRDRQWQSLYHFTVGGPAEDLRLATLPAYEHLAADQAIL